MEYIKYRAKRYEEKGTASATDHELPRKRPRFEKETLRPTVSCYRENDTESASESSSIESVTRYIATKPLLKRGFGFKGNFPEPPTSSITASSPVVHERERSKYDILGDALQCYLFSSYLIAKYVPSYSKAATRQKKDREK